MLAHTQTSNGGLHRGVRRQKHAAVNGWCQTVVRSRRQLGLFSPERQVGQSDLAWRYRAPHERLDQPQPVQALTSSFRVAITTFVVAPLLINLMTVSTVVWPIAVGLLRCEVVGAVLCTHQEYRLVHWPAPDPPPARKMPKARMLAPTVRVAHPSVDGWTHSRDDGRVGRH